MELLKDKFGRKFPYIRLSITDVCNFKCGYCLPNGFKIDKSDNRTFLSLEEIEALMGHIATQPKAEDLVIASPRETMGAGGLVTGDDIGYDELFNEAVKLVVIHQQGSISLIQRRLKVGYSRAARLIDEMEQAGIVGAFTGSKAREVLVDEAFLETLE